MNADQIATARRMALPGVAEDWREYRAFARRHRLAMRGPTGYRAFRQARRFAVDLLPAMPLTGLAVDVGANHGQFASALLRVAPEIRLLCVEPEPHTAEALQRNVGGDARVTIHRGAVSDRSGTAELHVTDNTVYASLQAPLPSLTANYARGAQVASRVSVNVSTVDDLVSEPVTVLKVDVQGAERAVLSGAEQTLKATTAVLLEINYVPHYEAESSFAELHDIMLAAGFRLHALGPPQRSASTGLLLWADACYVRV